MSRVAAPITDPEATLPVGAELTTEHVVRVLTPFFDQAAIFREIERGLEGRINAEARRRGLSSRVAVIGVMERNARILNFPAPQGERLDVELRIVVKSRVTHNALLSGPAWGAIIVVGLIAGFLATDKGREVISEVTSFLGARVREGGDVIGDTVAAALFLPLALIAGFILLVSFAARKSGVGGG